MGHTKLILAGGLTPQNVSDAVAAVNPYGVDTASGVEMAPGLKDPTLSHAIRKTSTKIAAKT